MPGQRDSVAASGEKRASLCAFIAEWLHVRLDRNPDTYAAWAKARGWHLTLEGPHAASTPTMRESERRMAYEYCNSGRPMPQDLSAMDFFRDQYACHFDRADMVMRFEAVTGGEAGCDILFKRLHKADQDPAHPDPYPLQRYDGIERWAGFATAGDLPHWSPDLRLKDVLERDGEVLVGIVSTALRAESGAWTPTTFAAYFDPESDRWHFHQITYSNSLNMHLGIVR